MSPLEDKAGNRSPFVFLLGLSLAVPLCLVLGLLAVQVGTVGLFAPLERFGEPHFRQAVVLSLATSTLSATLAVLLAVPAAYALARWRFPGATVVDVLLDFPLVLSPVALGVCLILLLKTPPGEWLEARGLRFIFEVPGIVLAQTVVAFALASRVLKAAFAGVDPRLEQVARFLGCTRWGAFRKVTLPLVKRSLAAAFILAWARSIGEFGASVTLAGAVPGKTETLPIAIHLRMASADIPGAVSMILVLSFLSLAVLFAVRLAGGRP